MKYVIRTTVDDVYHYQPVTRVEHDTTVHRVDRGWYVKLSGAFTAIHIGDEKPVMQAGDTVRVTIELDNEQS